MDNKKVNDSKQDPNSSETFKSTDIYASKASNQADYFAHVKPTFQDKLRAKAKADKAARAAKAQDPVVQKRRRKAIITILSVLILAAIAGIITLIIVSIQHHNQETAASVDFPACLEENIPEESVRSVADDVNIIACETYSESKNIEQYIDTFTSYEYFDELDNNSKASVYSALARNLYNYRVALAESGVENHEYDSRIIEYAKQADIFNPTWMTAWDVLNYASNLGDDAAASEYQAIYDSRDPYNGEEIDPNVQAAG